MSLSVTHVGWDVVGGPFRDTQKLDFEQIMPGPDE